MNSEELNYEKLESKKLEQIKSEITKLKLEQLEPEKFYAFTRAQIEHEDRLINNRMTWLLVFQGFLFSAYGVSFVASASLSKNLTCIEYTNELFLQLTALRQYLPVIGIISSILVGLQVLAANRSIGDLRYNWQKKVPSTEPDKYPQINGDSLFKDVPLLIDISVVLALPVLLIPSTWGFLGQSGLAWSTLALSLVFFSLFTKLSVPLIAKFKNVAKSENKIS